MTRKNLVKKAGRILIKEGPVELIRSSGRFVYKRTPFSPGQEPFQIKRSLQTEKRWKLIASELSEDDDNLLDIGCDAGVLTSKAARTGRLAIGVDRHEVAHSQKKIPRGS
jgi:2-polyprenyl-3-methyl-5-hydroxy-6-metoxy-1,4-benzoquinol methylase